MEIKVIPKQNQSLRDLLLKKGITLTGECAGRGHCGKCQVLVNGKTVLACQFVPAEPIIVHLPRDIAVRKAPPLTANFSQSRPLLLVVDIGTTTITLAALDSGTGRARYTETVINPQSKYGADVVSRIANWRRVSQIPLTELLKQYCQRRHIDRRRTGMVVGNTVMLHFLLGKNPTALGVYPYQPKLRLKTVLNFRINGLRLKTLPILGSFLGSDCTAAILASGMHCSEKISLLIDAGTNGEVVLGNKFRLFACSTAAGPAFEGSTITCGSLAIPGAITAARYQQGKWRLKTVGKRKPRGICGSGVLDVIAEALKYGIIDSTGRINSGNQLLLYADGENQVYLTQSDIRELQVAKAAITVGIKLLFKEWFGEYNPDPGKITRIFLTGRFGNKINPSSAFAIGLLPAGKIDILYQHPNLAHLGAIRAARNPQQLIETFHIARISQEILLAEHPDFTDRFIESMLFQPWH